MVICGFVGFFFLLFGLCLKIGVIWCFCWSMNDYGYVCMLCEFISVCVCVVCVCVFVIV